jgi:hypothetical protein
MILPIVPNPVKTLPLPFKDGSYFDLLQQAAPGHKEDDEADRPLTLSTWRESTMWAPTSLSGTGPKTVLQNPRPHQSLASTGCTKPL